MSDIESKVRPVVTSLIEENDMYLYDIVWEREGNDYFLRIFLDFNEGSLDLQSCAKISEKISERLDEVDLIDEEYFLEVSSPGAERPLSNEELFANALNEYIHVDFINPIKGLDFVEGYLTSYENQTALVEYRVKAVKKKIEFKYEEIKKARIAIKF